MYESKDQPLLTARHFRRRVVKHILYALLVLVITIAIGSAVHVFLESVSWSDAVLNTALVVSGIGPYIIPESAIGKLFLAAYSMFVGLVFAATLGIILAPVAHRMLHKFHLDTSGNDDDDSQ